MYDYETFSKEFGENTKLPHRLDSGNICVSIPGFPALFEMYLEKRGNDEMSVTLYKTGELREQRIGSISRSQFCDPVKKAIGAGFRVVFSR